MAVAGDGDGFVTCAQGHMHWGRFGAAGLLLTCAGEDGRPLVLLQLRAQWSHEGGTWALPGGARDSHEDSTTTALREAVEEVGLDPADVEVVEVFRDDHGGWAYDTVLARCDGRLATVAHAETTEARWIPAVEVATLRLHPGFAVTWPDLLKICLHSGAPPPTPT